MKRLTGMTAMLLLGVSQAMAQTPAPADEQPGHAPDAASMPAMQEHMKSMQDLMVKIRGTKDEAERKRLLQQHSKAMQEQMGRMRAMGVTMGGMGGMGAMGGGPNAMGDAMMQRMMSNHQAMQGRMQMMEMMMDQMIQHQDAQERPKARK